MEVSDKTPRRIVIEPEVVEEETLPAVPSAPPPAPVPERDLLAAALRSLKSANTRKAYESHWRAFAKFHGFKPAPFIDHIMSRHKADALDLVHEYREYLEGEGRAPSTIAVHMRAISSMIDRWYRAEVFPWTLKGLIQAPTPDQYTDVKGVSPETVKGILRDLEMLGTPESLRDRAIVLLLHDGGLRSREARTLDIVHFKGREVLVWPKGRARGIRRPQAISKRAETAVKAWLEHRGTDPGPLFHRYPVKKRMEQLTADDVRYIVERAARRIGVDKSVERVSPHRFRHAGITYLARRNVPIKELKDFARHASIDTTTIYVHNAANAMETLAGQFDDDEGGGADGEG